MRRRDSLVEFINNFSVKPALINDYLVKIGETPMQQGGKLTQLLLRPALDLRTLAAGIKPLADFIASLGDDRIDEIIEAVEIMVKYRGYLEREKLLADKARRLEGLVLGDKFDYASLTSLSTEARQKLARIRPQTVGQASRIPGVSPSDINILLLLLGR